MTRELGRAAELTDVLASAIRSAKSSGSSRISMRLECAEELVQLLSDSLKAAKTMDCREMIYQPTGVRRVKKIEG